MSRNVTKQQRTKVKVEVDMFKTEYPDYTDEHISDYLELCDNYTPEMKDLFCELLGY